VSDRNSSIVRERLGLLDSPAGDSSFAPRHFEADTSSHQQAMKVLVAHNFYQQPGGEDQVFADEVAMLREHGHTVIEHTVHNDSVAQLRKLELAKKTLWNQAAHDEFVQIIRRERPEIAHFHNTFPLLSPAVYYACHSEGVKVVQTLHNFRLFCPAATFFRDGHVCEDCMHAIAPWPAVAHACYRGNRAASAVSASMLVYHRVKRTWQDEVDIYIALTEFSRQKFIEGGLPPEKIVVKANFVSHDPNSSNSHPASTFETIGGAPTIVIGPSPTTWYAIDTSPLRACVRIACTNVPWPRRKTSTVRCRWSATNTWPCRTCTPTGVYSG